RPGRPPRRRRPGRATRPRGRLRPGRPLPRSRLPDPPQGLSPPDPEHPDPRPLQAGRPAPLSPEGEGGGRLARLLRRWVTGSTSTSRRKAPPASGVILEKSGDLRQGPLEPFQGADVALARRGLLDAEEGGDLV